jgi:hypothetical protein
MLYQLSYVRAASLYRRFWEGQLSVMRTGVPTAT